MRKTAVGLPSTRRPRHLDISTGASPSAPKATLGSGPCDVCAHVLFVDSLSMNTGN